MWRDHVSGIEDDVYRSVGVGMATQYRAIGTALQGAHAYVTYGNVDRPEMLRDLLPDSARFVDGEVIEIEGFAVGFAGGGVPRLGTEGEVDPDDMAAKLEQLGAVDILCTHVPPALEPLARDVVGGGFKGSQEILHYVDRYQPRAHFFGDTHQPQAVQWTRGTTMCRNVGYFRATGRPFRYG